VELGFGKSGLPSDIDHIFAAGSGKCGDVGFRYRVLEAFEKRVDRDWITCSLIVGCSAGSISDLHEIALAAEASALSAKTCVGVVDRIDGYPGSLSIFDGCCDVGAVLIHQAGAAVIRVDAIGNHEDEARFAGGRGGLLQVDLCLLIGWPFLNEVGEAEVWAGADSCCSLWNAKRLRCCGVVGGEVLGRDDAAVLHVADENFSAGAEVLDKAMSMATCAPVAGTTAMLVRGVLRLSTLRVKSCVVGMTGALEST
jgi:hypothetical protein